MGTEVVGTELIQSHLRTTMGAGCGEHTSLHGSAGIGAEL